MRLIPLVALTLIASSAGAQQGGGPQAALRDRVAEDHHYGVGASGTVLTWGVSGLADVTPRISLQASVGALGTVTALGGAVWYRFNQNDAYDLFGYGGASYLSLNNIPDEFGPTSAVGLGGGVGIEWDWSRIFRTDSFPPLYGNASIGINTYTTGGLNLSYLAAGGGIYYRF